MDREDEARADELRRAASAAWSRAQAACQQSIRLAAEIARTEEDVAVTYERLARDRPAEADRLLALAAEARRFAHAERESVASFAESPSRAVRGG